MTRRSVTGLGVFVGFLLILAVFGLALRWVFEPASQTESPPARGPEVGLPPAPFGSEMSLTDALARRRSVRAFTAREPTPEEVAQLCWAAQGITNPQTGFRTAPSAGAIYPLVVFVADKSGVREYVPERHTYRVTASGDVRPQLRAAALEQPAVGDAPVLIVIAMDPSRTAAKYGRRAERYCLLEAGHVAQNVLLKATSFGLGGVPIAAFDETRVGRTLNMARGLEPVYILPIGTPAE